MSRERSYGVVLGLLVLLALAGGRVPSVVATATVQGGVIEGRVIDNATRAPVPDATVRATTVSAAAGRTGAPPRLATTDANGHFRIVGVPPGRLNLTASAPGYIPSAWRPTSSSQRPQLRPGEQLTDLEVPLERAASLGGVVRDASGAPVPFLPVQVYRRVIPTARRVWSDIPQRVTTDADGRFLVEGLYPGEYVVSVHVVSTTMPRSVVDVERAPASAVDASVLAMLTNSRAPEIRGAADEVGAFLVRVGASGARGVSLPAAGADGRARTYRTTFHPAATTLDEASVVRLMSGEARRDIDVALQVSQTSAVSGQLTGFDGEPASFVGLRLFSEGAQERSVDLDGETAATVTDATGAFTFLRVPGGSVTLKAIVASRPAGRNAPPAPRRLEAWATARVDVAGVDVRLEPLRLRAPMAIRGRFVFEGGPGPDRLRTRVWLATAESALFSPAPVVALDRERTFVMPGLMPGRYHLWGGDVAGWAVASVTADGRDVTRAPIDVVDRDVNVTLVLTRDVTRVDGIVRDESGRPVGGARIVVFPADYARWIADGQSIRVMRSLRALPSGVYSIAELPEGSYLLAAFTGDDPEGWPDRRVVESVAGVATLVRLTGGRAVRQDLVPVR